MVLTQIGMAGPVLDDFSKLPAGMYFHGSWKDGGALIHEGALSLISATASGGLSIAHRQLNLEHAKGLEITAKLQPGNQAVFFQVILTDDSTPQGGQSSHKARFQFPLAALSEKKFDSLRSDKVTASYYTYDEANPAKETPLPAEKFNFSSISAVSYQGEYSGKDMRLEIKRVEAVP